MTARRILAGDLGGSKTLLRLAELNSGSVQVLHESSLPSRTHASFDDLLAAFLSELGDVPPIDSACIAVAGPVHDGVVRITNLPWMLDQRALSARLGGAEVRLINDMQGMAYGLLRTEPARLIHLSEGRPDPYGTRALLGIGTGLGVAQMVWTGERYVVLPSEGGHVDFAPREDFDLGYWRALRAEGVYPSWETVVSGPGLVRLYRHVCREQGITDTLLASAPAGADPAAVILAHATGHADGIAIETLDHYCRYIGTKAAHLALTSFATGGVYLVGGVSCRLGTWLPRGTLVKAFLTHPTMADLLRRIPLQSSTEPSLALDGATWLASGLV